MVHAVFIARKSFGILEQIRSVKPSLVGRATKRTIGGLWFEFWLIVCHCVKACINALAIDHWLAWPSRDYLLATIIQLEPRENA